MRIKSSGRNQSSLKYFDLLGTNEVALTKSFAFLLGHDPRVLFEFLHLLGISAYKNKSR